MLRLLPFVRPVVLRRPFPDQPSARRHQSSTRRNFAQLVSTPIYYVNGFPHIGHASSSLSADALTRWRRLRDPRQPVLFSTGTDEHGEKVLEAAHIAGEPVEKFVERVSNEFRRLSDVTDVQYDDFVRTTEARHHDAVHEVWRRLKADGHIYLGQFEGWYSVPDETFLTETQIETKELSDGAIVRVSKESGHPVEWVKEENYMFRLSAFQDKLLEWIDTSETSIVPERRRREVRSYVANGLHDLSVSRQRSAKTEWAIRVPDDDAHTVYVWLDALVNYLTACGYPNEDQFRDNWPSLVHVVGKDIVRFHAVYFPAFLFALGLEPPRHVLAHAHWTVEREKMSKSKGNVIDPFSLVERFGSCAVRYVLLSDAGLVDDGIFSEDAFRRRVNGDLANTYGNLFQRVTGKRLLTGGCVPQPSQSFETDETFLAALNLIYALPDRVGDAWDKSLWAGASIQPIFEVLREVNRFVSDTEPWKVIKTDAERAGTIVYIALEALRVSSVLLSPIIPVSSARVLDALGVEATERTYDAVRAARSRLRPGAPVSRLKTPLFPRVDEDACIISRSESSQ